ncbi:MAG: tetratricopeptide repeat protein [Treponema sp.]|nr:tetratricopeptide repeat protein [Treponema sp.]MBR4789968.1 tetratricopeptide repeat protein [Treponema sp.]
MSEKNEKSTASEKLNGFLEKNRKPVLITFIVGLVLIVGFIAGAIIVSATSKKDLAAVEAYYYELTDSSTGLEDTEITKRATECIENLAPYTKKGGIAGVRANMLSAELAYILKDYEGAIAYYDAAIAKGKKSYTAPLCYYNKGASYEELGKLAEAAEAYKTAAEFDEFVLVAHAYFSLGRVLEAQGDYAGAVEAYKTLNDKVSDDDWGNLAKTRIIELQSQGKAN